MTNPNISAPVAGTPPGKISVATDCLFLDFDGTLVDFARHPDEVELPDSVRHDVAAIFERFGGALAVVSGRSVESIDRFFAPLVLPVAGIHGMMRRNGAGEWRREGFDQNALDELACDLHTFARRHTGLLLERKPGSLALHYRNRPDLESASATAVDTALRDLGTRASTFHRMFGKMVIEVRAAASTKGNAIAAFMAEAPFAGRRPVFAGDDVTDEYGFREVNTRNGISIKVGDGETEARYRVPDIGAFRMWLRNLASQ